VIVSAAVEEVGGLVWGGQAKRAGLRRKVNSNP